MKIYISETVSKNLIDKYPHLTDNIIQYLFFVGNIGREETMTWKRHEDNPKISVHEYTYEHYLGIPDYLAEQYKVHNKMFLDIDDDGTIYKVDING